MADAKTICNLGLGKITASRISSLSPPKSPLENHLAVGYPHWKAQELSKRRWHFATFHDTLVLNATVSGDAYPFRYALPNNMLFPVRPRGYPTWIMRGNVIMSTSNQLTLEYVKNVAEDEFDPLFTDVLAWRIAAESVGVAKDGGLGEQRNAWAGYKEAIDLAALRNAFVLDMQPVDEPDESFDWLRTRIYGTPP
jgi:hypothetical protein